MAKLIVVLDIVWDGTVSRGGHTMCELQWLRGLTELGHDVLLVDFIDHDFGEGREAMLRAFGSIITSWWKKGRTALVNSATLESLYGLSAREVETFAADADAVLTLGALGRRDMWPLIENVRPRLVIDRDPVYTQSWIVDDLTAQDIYGEHDFYFTVGANIGTDRCRVKSFGIDWIPTWHPIVLKWWAAGRSADAAAAEPRPFTTISDWYTQGYIEFEGRILGPKVEEFRRFLELPTRVHEPLEIALLISPDDPDIGNLKDNGWVVKDPRTICSPEDFRSYILNSAGELSCAKGGYAHTRCGWFSDRSEAYLAAGRPVVLQSTGFEDVLPTGKGLFAFTSYDEAAEALRCIRGDYATHSRAAAEIAAEYFDSSRVLAKLLARAGIESSNIAGPLDLQR